MGSGKGCGVLELLSNQDFLSALAAAIGPLAFFAAPTEEIEQLLFAQDLEELGAYEEAIQDDVSAHAGEALGLPEAA